MSTLRDQILTAIEARLALASADVYPDDDALDESVSSAILYGAWRDDAETNNLVDLHRLTIPMAFFARGATARNVADALHAEVNDLLMADRSFGGLVKKFELGPCTGRTSPVGSNSVQLQQSFAAEYLTARGSLTAAP